jgi:hypothetical protein
MHDAARCESTVLMRTSEECQVRRRRLRATIAAMAATTPKSPAVDVRARAPAAPHVQPLSLDAGCAPPSPLTAAPSFANDASNIEGAAASTAIPLSFPAPASGIDPASLGGGGPPASTPLPLSTPASTKLAGVHTFATHTSVPEHAPQLMKFPGQSSYGPQLNPTGHELPGIQKPHWFGVPVPPQLSGGEHVPQLIIPPHPSGAIPQSAFAGQCRGHAQTFGVPPAPQTSVPLHVPQSIVPPQPSSSGPQLSGAGHVVFGVHTAH